MLLLLDPIVRNSLRLNFSGEYGRSVSVSSGLSGMLACEGISKDLYRKHEATEEDVVVEEDSENRRRSPSGHSGSQNLTLCLDP